MPISANSLFHFTSNLDVLISILTRDYWPQYSLENYNILSPRSKAIKELEFGIPMVAFCDIPFSMVSRHMKNYGRYGIGMNKRWGINKGITPVIYTNKHSELARIISRISKELFTGKKDINQPPAKDFNKLLWFIKPYEGLFSHNKRKIENYRFYDEREWRYIPKEIPTEYLYGLPKTEFNNDFILERANLFFFDKRLEFTSDDIKYIIVSKEDEIQELMDVLSNAAHSIRYPKSSQNILASKITTCERILEDY
jgi:hypothetical protein